MIMGVEIKSFARLCLVILHSLNVSIWLYHGSGSVRLLVVACWLQLLVLAWSWGTEIKSFAVIILINI